MRKAVSELADENVLIRYQGKGTFVASHAEERSKFPFLRVAPERGELKELSAELIEFRRLRADSASMRQLRLSAGSGLCLIRRVMLMAGRRACYEEVRLPASRFKGLSMAVIAEHECMLYSMYESAFGMRIVHAEEQLKAVAAPREVATVAQSGRRGAGSADRARRLYLHRRAGGAAPQLVGHAGALLSKPHNGLTRCPSKSSESRSRRGPAPEISEPVPDPPAAARSAVHSASDQRLCAVRRDSGPAVAAAEQPRFDRQLRALSRG